MKRFYSGHMKNSSMDFKKWINLQYHSLITFWSRCRCLNYQKGRRNGNNQSNIFTIHKIATLSLSHSFNHLNQNRFTILRECYCTRASKWRTNVNQYNSCPYILMNEWMNEREYRVFYIIYMYIYTLKSHACACLLGCSN